MLQYYDKHHMVKRIKDLRDTYTTLFRSEIEKKLEVWDNNQGRAMHHAERQLQHSTKAYEWSPALRGAGVILWYWLLQLRENQHIENDAGTFELIEQTVSQHYLSFQLPLS